MRRVTFTLFLAHCSISLAANKLVYPVSGAAPEWLAGILKWSLICFVVFIAGYVGVGLLCRYIKKEHLFDSQFFASLGCAAALIIALLSGLWFASLDRPEEIDHLVLLTVLVGAQATTVTLYSMYLSRDNKRFNSLQES